MDKKPVMSVTKKDLEITYFGGTGGGGQYRNKHKICARIKHPPTGVIVTGQEERSKEQNLKNAFRRLAKHPTFRTWLKVETARKLMGEEEYQCQLEERVNESMKEKNLKIEYYDPNK